MTVDWRGSVHSGRLKMVKEERARRKGKEKGKEERSKKKVSVGKSGLEF